MMGIRGPKGYCTLLAPPIARSMQIKDQALGRGCGKIFTQTSLPPGTTCLWKSELRANTEQDEMTILRKAVLATFGGHEAGSMSRCASQSQPGQPTNEVSILSTSPNPDRPSFDPEHQTLKRRRHFESLPRTLALLQPPRLPRPRFAGPGRTCGRAAASQTVLNSAPTQLSLFAAFTITGRLTSSVLSVSPVWRLFLSHGL
jgi:hypothetical protein